jgi:uncharacterized tellurite resistance protein B-like protein
MIPATYRQEIQALLTKLQPLSGFNNEASEIYMAGLGLITTVVAADEHEKDMRPEATEAIIHELKKFEDQAQVFLDDVLHFHH